MFEGGTTGGMEGAIDDGAMLRQNLAPVGKKLRVVVLTDGVGLEARPKVYVHAGGVLALRPGRPLRACASSGLRLRRARKEQQQ